ncbi:MAG: penicillin acylase family protein [Thermoleophilia bacterium]
MRIAGLALAMLLLAAGAAASARPRDHAAVALNILPAGENGSLQFNRNTNDQAKLYDALTPLWDTVTLGDVKRLLKPATLGLAGAKPSRVEQLTRPGATILRDGFGVPHVRGKTQADVMYGAGWATAEDRGLLLGLIRGPSRVAALDIPGIDPIALALSGRSFVPSAQTEAYLAKQVTELRASGAEGRKLAGLIDAFVAGINGYYRATGSPVQPFTANDVVADAALIAARFGANGGDEPRRSEFLAALQRDFGAAKGRSIWDDLREANDPEAPVSVPGSFPYSLPSGGGSGSVVLEPGSVTAAPTPPAGAMSNAILIGAKRSATGHPIFVAGPQVGYFFPQFFLEADLHGGGFDARGVLFPGVPFVVIGRGLDFVWSATSSRSDNIDVFAETLCGGDDAHYVFRGECRAMTTFNAGELVRQDDRTPLRFRETVHGPVVGYARTVAGARVALALQRSTRGRELQSSRTFYALDTNRVTSARSFLRTMAGVEFSFDWFYADNRDIAMFSSGRLPVRAPNTDPSLPTVGTGDFEWRGFLTPAQHAQGINPPSGTIVNWNNKPAADVGATDENWAYGSVQRVQLLTAGVAVRQKHTVATVASLMNKAATQDLRAIALVPTIAEVLQGSAAPSPRAQRLLELLQAWTAAGASRLDRNGDGTVDDPGAAIMDAAYPAIAEVVMKPALGQDLGLLRSLEAASDDANIQGSSYLDGWYGIIDKDLRTLLGKPVRGAFANRYCGLGDLAACRFALWVALESAGAELAAEQGPDPAAWRADANAERIRFTSGILPDTMRWTNRPTFQQIFSFRTHRKR